MPELRFVIEALVDSLKKSFYVLILIFILLYIYMELQGLFCLKK